MTNLPIWVRTWHGMLFSMPRLPLDQYDRFASIEYRDEPVDYQQLLAKRMRRSGCGPLTR